MSIFNTIEFVLNHPLNRDRRMDALIRYVKWQIGSRLVPGEVVFNWVNGSKFMVRTGETGLTGNIYAGLHEFADMAFLLHVLRMEDLFIDVGANVGSYSILACSAIGARGYAFEPVPKTFDRLVDNLRLNNVENKVKCFNSGLGDKDGEMRFTCDLDTVNHIVANDERADNTIAVKVSQLDMFLRDEMPTLMKIDVEGFETPVLMGAGRTLQKPSLKAVIMELNGSGARYGFDESKIIDLMRGHGFGTYSYDPFGRKLINLNGRNRNSGNTIFIRDELAILERLKSSPLITINNKWF